MRKLFKERKLFKGGNYMRKYGTLNISAVYYKNSHLAQTLTGSLIVRVNSLVCNSFFSSPFQNIYVYVPFFKCFSMPVVNSSSANARAI